MESMGKIKIVRYHVHYDLPESLSISGRFESKYKILIFLCLWDAEYMSLDSTEQ